MITNKDLQGINESIECRVRFDGIIIEDHFHGDSGNIRKYSKDYWVYHISSIPDSCTSLNMCVFGDYIKHKSILQTVLAYVNKRCT